MQARRVLRQRAASKSHASQYQANTGGGRKIFIGKASQVVKTITGFARGKGAASMGAAAGRADGDGLRDIEAHAVRMAREAGGILRGHFERALDVRYKDDKQSDPVTNADLECQSYLSAAIAARFPAHGILGEEDDAELREKMDKRPAPDFVWALDPLDGTRNFLSGLPLYACSIGVLHKGAPVAGAVFLPWPSDKGGIVLHARKGGGAFADDEPIAVAAADEPVGNRLITLPGGFGAMFGVKPPLRDKFGELRMTGSIAYELAMVAKGVTQYTITTAPFLWDAAGGVALAREAGCLVLQGRRPRGFAPFAPPLAWHPLETFAPGWRSGRTTMGELRGWRAPLLLASPGASRYVAGNLSARRRVLARVRRRIRGRKRK